MAKKSVIINNKEYVMPKADDIQAYLHYLNVRDSVMNTEKGTGLYTASQFEEMIECICEMYGNQFTPEDVMAKGTGLSVSAIIMEFASIEIGIGEDVNKSMEKVQANFQSGK